MMSPRKAPPFGQAYRLYEGGRSHEEQRTEKQRDGGDMLMQVIW